MHTWRNVLSRANNKNPEPDQKITKTDEQWMSLLTSEQYRVTRCAGTERAFSSSMCSLFEPGIYQCICCETQLFDAQNKYESNSGWPSFSQPIKDNAVAYKQDSNHGMQRIECLCNTCDAHLGHVFPDGPEPTGLRFCINAVSIKKQVE